MTTRSEARAERLLNEHALTTIPVDVESLAKACGAEVRYRSLGGDVSGLLVRTDDDVVVIGVDRNQPKHRQRFTIAHELGHLLMHPGRSVIVEHLRRPARVNFRDASSGLATDREEIEANQFAAGLLMPRSNIEDAYAEMAGRLDDSEIPARLARAFQVSEQAMGYRLMNLALIRPA